MSSDDPLDRVTPKRFLMLIMLSLCWGSFWPVMKVALAEMPLFSFRALSGMLGAAFILLVALLSGRNLRFPREHLWPLIGVSLVATTCWFVLSAVGVMTIGSGRSTLIAYTMPLWSFILGIFLLGERPTAKRWLGLAIGLSGVLIMVSQDYEAFLAAPWGLVAMIMAAAIWALGTVLIKMRDWQMPNLTFAGWQTVFGTLPVCLVAVIFETFDPGEISTTAWLAMAYVGIVGVGIGVTLFFAIVRMLPISVTTLGILLVPVVGLLSSALTIERFLGWPEYVALGLILLSMTAVMPMPNLKRLFGQRLSGTG